MILEGITALATCPHDEFHAAVAYASESGCAALVQALKKTGGGWNASSKRWLISIDFGRTEPNALQYLADVSGSEVRIPNRVAVVHTPKLFPPFVFHSKAYLAKNTTSKDSLPTCLFVGSGNLTVSGLVLGNECGTLQQWTAPLRTAAERKHFARLRSDLAWFERMWSSADTLSNVLPSYKRLWRREHVALSEDQTHAAKLYKAAEPVTSGLEAVRLSHARGLWVETDTLYKNRGPQKSGNQLDLPRGSRVFFGFAPSEVPRNTVFGELILQCDGYEPSSRTMRFGNNMMDKINLPVPGTAAGPGTYDNSIVLFDRRGSDKDGRNRFSVRLGTEGDLAKWKKAATRSVEGEMHGGRRYGLLF